MISDQLLSQLKQKLLERKPTNERSQVQANHDHCIRNFPLPLHHQAAVDVMAVKQITVFILCRTRLECFNVSDEITQRPFLTDFPITSISVHCSLQTDLLPDLELASFLTQSFTQSLTRFSTQSMMQADTQSLSH